ncbi:MAG: 16S rRNA methyltransferase [Pyrobaculum sp.]
MILVLAESSIEPVPRELWSHPAVLADARRRGKKPGEMLLDRARHHPAMWILPQASRRGRPDIIHQSLLAFQYSPLARSGMGRAYVHTAGDRVIKIRPDARLPKNYNNFLSLAEQLYSAGRVPPRGDPLMEVERSTLSQLLERLGGRWVAMHERGERKPLWELGQLVKDAVVVVGGFPHGDFENQWVLREAEGVYRIGEGVLDAPQVVCRLVTAAEAALGLV